MSSKIIDESTAGTNNQQHTPDTYGEDNDSWYVERDGNQIAHGLTEEDARRIVACVNACEGYSTESLESSFSVVRRAQEIADQRDDLLAALKGADKAIVKALPFLHPDKEAVYCGEWLVHIREAIANTEGGAA